MPKRRRGVPPPPPDPSPAPATIDYSLSFNEIAASGAPGAMDFVKNHGLHLLLLETPSGFAIFCLCGAYIHLPDAIQNIWEKFATYGSASKIIWLCEFQKFDDKSSAINVGTGVNEQLTEMIMKWRRPGQKLVVGKPEYKSIIETTLGIPCLYDEVVMEVMWGMKHHMNRFVPAEESKLPKEDNLAMSQGLRMFLSRYGFDIKPEMPSCLGVMLLRRTFMSTCNILVATSRMCLALTMRIGTLKLATAFKIICSRKIDASDEMFSDDVRSKLLDDADKYKDLVFPIGCIGNYKNILDIKIVRNDTMDELASLVKVARIKAEPAEVPEKLACQRSLGQGINSFN
uniref:Nucleolar protein 58/56 N-terminal domain-containing protein n=1 Tax=Oryza punctata TaxID=4537 RepID=A0A0E0MFD4_ORYPU